MEKNYLDGKIKITLRQDYFLDVESEKGEKYSKVDAVRLFPVSRPENYLVLLDENKNELAIIRSLDGLDEQSKKELEVYINQYYTVPIISKVDKAIWADDTLTVTAQTSYGDCSFKVRSRPMNIVHLRNGNVIIRDINDCRYLILKGTKIERKAAELMYL